MPTYEYECLKCSYRFEKFQKMEDKPIKTCPKCKKPVRRLIGMGGGIIFKGAGFYATDYRKTKDSSATKEKKEPKTCPQDKNYKESSCNSCPLRPSEGK